MELENRLRAVEDRLAILDLKWLYADNADLKYTDDHRRKPQAEIDVHAWRQAECFSEDAVWDGGVQFGVQNGRQAIYENLRSGGWAFAVHYFTPLQITLRGDEGEGRWSIWQAGTLAKGDRAVFLSGLTEDRYARTSAGWKISYMAFKLRFMTPFEEPWTRRRNEPFKV